jgi:hypothetical protein
MAQRIPHAALAASVATLLLAATPTAAADDVIRVGIHPAGQRSGFVELRLNPGERKSVAIDLVNNGTDLLVRTYVADAYTIVNGGFGARFEADPRTGPATWLDYAATSVSMSAGEVVTSTATVTVPAGTRPGEYIAALVIQNEEPIAIGSASGLQQVVRAALAIVVDVPGARRSALSVGHAEHSFAAGTSIVGFPAMNDGNVRIRPDADFRLESATGGLVASADVALDSFYAGLPARVEIALDAPLAPGSWCARLVLRAPGAPDADSGRTCFLLTEDSPIPSNPGGGPTGTAPGTGADGDAGRSAPGWSIGEGAGLLLAAVLSLLLIRWRRRSEDRDTTDQSADSTIR